MDLEDLEKPEFYKYKVGDGRPNCHDGRLIGRYARIGDGKYFDAKQSLGCSNYPTCDFTSNLE